MWGRCYRYWIVEPLAATPGGGGVWLGVAGALLALEIGVGSAAGALLLCFASGALLVAAVRLVSWLMGDPFR